MCVRDTRGEEESGGAHARPHTVAEETVGNTAPFAGQTDVTDTPGHSGVPGLRMPVQPPEVRTSAFTCVAHRTSTMRTRAYARVFMHMHTRMLVR